MSKRNQSKRFSSTKNTTNTKIARDNRHPIIGPIYCKECILIRCFVLTYMDGDELPYLVNADSVKKYYTWHIVKNAYITEGSSLD